METQHYHKPEVLVLKGEDAIEVLEKYIENLTETKPEEMSEKQVKTIIKLATGLIRTIKHETSLEPTKHSHLLPKLKNPISKVISKIITDPVPQTSRKQPSTPSLPHRFPPPANQQLK